MRETILGTALTAVQSSGLSARELAERSGMSWSTCKKVLTDTDGSRRYHWSTIEFALRHAGCRLVVVTDSPQQSLPATGYVRRRFGGTRSRK